MAVIESWVRCDLKKPVQVQMLGGNLFSMDNQGNKIGVEVFDNGETATISGSVSGSVIRSDGSTVAVSGTLSGNKASIVLPQAAYAVPGFITIVIKLTASSVITTLAAVTGIVYRSSTDTVIDPGTIIPSIETLIAEIDAAVASIPADYSSLWTSLAPAFNASKTGGYKPGEYVTYDGKLWRFTSAHSGNWNASHATQVAIGSDLEKYFAPYYSDLTNIPDNSDLNSYTTPGNYVILNTTHAGTVSHVPAVVGGRLYVFQTVGPSAIVQLYITSQGDLYYRRANTSTQVFTDWRKVADSSDIAPFYGNKLLLDDNSDADGILTNSVYQISNGRDIVNWAFPGRAGTLITNEFTTGYYTQIAIPYNPLLTNKLAMRTYSSGSWGTWNYIRMSTAKADCTYYAFGDSITWGYSADYGHIQSEFNYPAMVGRLTGIEVHNVAVPGQGLIVNWNTETSVAAVIPTINQMIQNGDFANTRLVTVGWAYNDSSMFSSIDFGNPHADFPTSDTGITTWLGYYGRILAKLQTACPQAAVILVTGYGQPSQALPNILDNQFTYQRTFRDGVKTIREMYDALEEMANFHGFYCINQARGTVINRWNGSTIIGDNIHPTYYGYRIYGNFLGSMIASIYGNM